MAEAAARSALQKRAVDVAEPFSHFGRRRRNCGTGCGPGPAGRRPRNANKTQSIDRLAQELAYEYWHRMLFARFLAENHLLMHPDGVAVSLEECEELAPAADAGPERFVLAAAMPARMLPQIFRTDDLLLEIEFAPEQRLALENCWPACPEDLHGRRQPGLGVPVLADQEEGRGQQVGEKIDGRTLPAVTQLFTEHYMVQFLLHNTIGAWWCARHGISGPPGGAGIPPGKAPVEMPYLRWRDDGTPAAGHLRRLAQALKEFKMLDPCCGSGHFLVAAFQLLVPLRMHERDFGPRSRATRCSVKICSAWNSTPAARRSRLCPGPGCVEVPRRRREPLATAPYRPEHRLLGPGSDRQEGGVGEVRGNGNSRLRKGMERLYDLFQSCR